MEKTLIHQWLTARNLSLSETQYQQLANYQQSILTANEKMNLTTITDPTDFAIKHFIDSLSLLPLLPEINTMEAVSLVDIGTGAGFPGMVLKIARPDIALTLVDSLLKRVHFLRATLDALNIEATTFHARAEDMPRVVPTISYDICTARAVAPLKKLCKYALPLLKSGGLFLAMKGPDVAQESIDATPALAKYGGKIQEIVPQEIAANRVHTVVVIEKVV